MQPKYLQVNDLKAAITHAVLADLIFHSAAMLEWKARQGWEET